MKRKIQLDVNEINVVCFGSTSGPCLAQEAKNRNAREFSKEHPEAAKARIEAHYMDDYLGGTDAIEQAKQFIEDVIYVHSRPGFQICNLLSNDSNTLKDVNQDLISDCQKSLDKNL